MSKGLTSTPIEMALKGVVWEAAPEHAPQDAHDGPGLPYATHKGIWHFMGQEIRVYRLNDGRAIIEADDFWKILGVEDASPDDTVQRKETP